jgi:flagellar biosynthesis protein FliR
MMTRGLLVGARVSMLMVFAPFFGSGSIPVRLKAGLTLALAVLLYPSLPGNQNVLSATNWVRVLIGEMSIGLAMGLAIQFVFEGVLLAGQILGFQMGFSLENIIDPQTQVDTPVLAIFHQSIALLIFLQLGVHHWVLRGLAKSFEYLPPGVVALTPTTTAELMRAAGGMLLVGLQVAAPALVATFVTDVSLGFIGRAAPQFPVVFTGISIKSLTGVMILWGSVALWPRVLESHFQGALVTTERLLHLAR